MSLYLMSCHLKTSHVINIENQNFEFWIAKTIIERLTVQFEKKI